MLPMLVKLQADNEILEASLKDIDRDHSYWEHVLKAALLVYGG